MVEVVSKSNPENDYEGKMRDYPTMNIPHYLIVDPRNGTGLVLSVPHSTPEGRRYSTRRDFRFGETVQLGAYDIETADFPTY